jgi:cytochrome c peroxidase
VAAQTGPVVFDEAQVRRIESLGPWPSPHGKDPSNRVSGNAAAIEMGGRLFDDPALSKSGGIACTTCHRPAHAFTDGNERAQGLARGDRNTPSVLDLAGLRWYGWDGAQDNLWAQSLRPMLDPREMDSDLAHVASRVRNDPALRSAYRKAFGRAPTKDNEAVAVDVAKAIAAYLETLTSPRSAFDDFRDALVRGDKEAMARYPVLAQRGLAIFVGSGKCTTCHSGPRMSNGEFHDVGIPYFAEPGRVDPGRYGGIRKLTQSRYNLLGKYNDDRKRASATSTRHVVLDHRNYGEFKVPSLRGVSQTAPYMHNGSLATLRDVVRHYSHFDVERQHADGERILVPLDLDKYDVDALVAFLETL